jgi:hypothetical protein
MCLPLNGHLPLNLTAGEGIADFKEQLSKPLLPKSDFVPNVMQFFSFLVGKWNEQFLSGG